MGPGWRYESGTTKAVGAHKPELDVAQSQFEHRLLQRTTTRAPSLIRSAPVTCVQRSQ